MSASSSNSALNEILQWSKSRPAWQQYALKKIILGEDINIEELEKLCCAKHDFLNIDNNNVIFEPLEAEYIPVLTENVTNVSLISLAQLKNVNRLPSDSILSFGKAPGLTIVYGDNGAGKSGYARVIKKACRARGQAEPIQPNIYKKETDSKASAQFVIQTTEGEIPVDWQDGQEFDNRLGQIFLFDTDCAEHYISENEGTAFTPFGLDILEKLADLCNKISTNLKTKLDKIDEDIKNIQKTLKYNPVTSVGKLIASLNAKTDINSIETLVVLTEEENSRLTQLHALLADNSIVKAKKTESEANSIRNFRKILIKARKSFSDFSIKKFEDLLVEVKELSKNAKEFGETKFDESFLPSTGTQIWRALWDAAREYSISGAYRGKDFPVTGENARCVLCQSTLDAIAKEKLEIFNEFVNSKISQVYEQKKAELENIKKNLNNFLLFEEKKKIESILAGLAEQERLEIESIITVIDKRRNAVISLDKMDCNNIPPLPKFRSYHIISQLEKRLHKQAEMEKAADNPHERKLLEKELDELKDRQWLAGRKLDIFNQVQNYVNKANLEKSKNDTNPYAITMKNKDLTKKYVTETFCKKFKEEVEELGLKTLNVILSPKTGSRGTTKFELNLENVDAIKVEKVASEGEKRTIALAFFLAELSQSSHSSALVFDDPVSSLDHLRKENVAKRLVKESQFRQVIVFTHDTAFLCELQMAAEKMETAPHSLYIEWNNGVPGYCINGLPWLSQSAGERLYAIETDLKKVTETWEKIPNESNKKKMSEMYSRLRATLERIVECHIFGDVIIRFRREIKFGRLKDAIGFSQKEFDELARLHKLCSEVTEAHNKPQNQNPRTRTPEELKSDINAVRALLDMITERKKLNEKAAKTKCKNLEKC